MSNIFDRLVSKDDTSAESLEIPQRRPTSPESSDGEAPPELGHTPSDVKQIVQELLKHGHIEESRKPEFFRRATLYDRAIGAILEPLDLELRLDTHRGVAFLVVAQAASTSPDSEEGWTHPLVRRQRLTLEQSLLIAILRQMFVMHEQESGVGQSDATFPVDSLLPQFLTYSGDSGSDARNESRLLNLLDQLKTYGIVSEVDNKQEFAIRPMIAHLANPDSLTALLKVLRQQSEATDTPELES